MVGLAWLSEVNGGDGTLFESLAYRTSASLLIEIPPTPS